MSNLMERLVFMQCEDGIVSFEKEDGNTIMYPATRIPEDYKEGDIIKAVIYEENIADGIGFIEFYGIDVVEMERRRSKNEKRRSRLRNRIRNN